MLMDVPAVEKRSTKKSIYTTADKVGILSRVPLFAGIPKEAAEALAAITGARSLRAKEELFHKGDDANELYVVVSGHLAIKTTGADGNELMFAVTGPGEVCGEIALLTGSPRTATVRAIGATSLLYINRRQLLELLHDRPEVAIELLSVVATRVAKLSLLLEDTQFLNLPGRLARKLRDFAAIFGRPVPGEPEGVVRIELKLNQEEWGDLVGTTRESVNKQFGKWTEQGVISIDRRIVTIRDSKAISQAADSLE